MQTINNLGNANIDDIIQWLKQLKAEQKTQDHIEYKAPLLQLVKSEHKAPMIRDEEIKTRTLWEQYVTFNMKKAVRVKTGERIEIHSNHIDGRIIAEWDGLTGRISEGRTRGSLLERLATW